MAQSNFFNKMNYSEKTVNGLEVRMMFMKTSCKAFAMGFCAILFNFYISGNSANNQTIETLKQFMDIYAVQNLDTGLKDFLKHIETKNNNAKLNEK
jgi:hypothetical protein